MAITVNPQITDAVTQSNVKVLGESPAFAMSAMYQALGHSTGILFENAIGAQQQQNTLAMAASNQGVLQIYSVDTTAAAGATEKVAQTGIADNLTSMLTLVNERIFHNDGKPLICPLISMFGASNELPEGKDLEALFDRFLVRFEVGYLLRPANLKLVLAASEPSATPAMTMAIAPSEDGHVSE